MSSFFGWVDFSEAERDKMHQVIRLFKDTETRDELGIGTIRDSFADLLFPGTSTIQTRVKYMLFVPWLYSNLERQKVSSRDFKARLKRKETELIWGLLNSGETEGVIGRDARDNLQRFPSSIYWAGLQTWGIRLFNGTQDQYCRYMDYYYKRQKSRLVGEDKEYIDELSDNWHPHLPEVPRDFPRRATFDLTPDEAEYLQERIKISCKDSLLAFLVTNTKPTNDAGFIWEHPQFGMFPEHLKQWINHAQNFSEIMHGAALLYNYLLAREKNSIELIDDYHERTIQWKDCLKTRRGDFINWRLRDFWQICSLTKHRIHPMTKAFVEEWIRLCLDEKTLGNILELPQAQYLIRERERRLKGKRARLENKQALDLWSGEAGTGQLGFRWFRARGMVNDILAGLGKKGGRK